MIALIFSASDMYSQTALTGGITQSGNFTAAGQTATYSYNQSVSYWSVVGIRPPSTSDFDIELSANTNFSPTLASSTLGTGKVDFIVADYNHSPTGAQYVRLKDYSGAGTYYVEYESGAHTLGVPSNSGTLSWTSNEIVKVWDVYLQAGVTYTFKLRTLSGLQDYGISLYKSNTAAYYAGRSSAAATSDITASGTDEYFSYTPSVTDYYGFVVWSNDNYGTSGTYDITVSTLATNNPLSSAASPGQFSYYQTNTNWSVVALRSGSGANDNLSLYTNSSYTTLATQSALASGIEIIATENDTITQGYFRYPKVDRTGGTSQYTLEWDESSGYIGLGNYTTTAWNANTVAKVYNLSMSQGAKYRIKLHTVSGSVDAGLLLFKPNGSLSSQARSAALQSADANGAGLNEEIILTAPVSGSYALVVYSNTATAGSFDLSFNQEILAASNVYGQGVKHYAFDQQNAAWSVVGVRPPSNGNADIVLYNNHTYTTPLATSNTAGTGQVDFVVGDQHHTAKGIYYVSTDDPVNPSRVNYTTQWEGGNESLTAPGTNSGYAWAKTDVVKIWDVQLVSGINYTFNLSVSGGTPNLGMAIFRSSSTTESFYFGRSGAAAIADVNGNGGGESFSYTPSGALGTLDHYGIVVWSNDTTSAGSVRIDIAQPLMTSATPVSASSSPGLYAFNQSVSGWGVIALRPQSFEDFDLELHGASDYNNLLAQSTLGTGAVEFIAGDFRAGHAPLKTYFTKAVQNSGKGPYAIEWEGTNETLPVEGNSGTISWGTTAIAKVYNVPLVGGRTYKIKLDFLTNAFDAGMALFQPSTGNNFFPRGSQAMLADVAGAGNESMTFTAPMTDTYGLVVWGNTQPASAATFAIDINQPPVVSVPIPDVNFSEDQGSGLVANSNLNGNFSDIQPLSYSASVLKGGGITASVAGSTLKVSTVSDSVGQYPVVVTANDGTFFTSDTLIVTLAPVNDLPYRSALIPDPKIAEDEQSVFASKLSGYFTDIDNPVLSFGVTALNSGVSAYVSNDSLYLSGQQDFNGNANLRISATDGSFSVYDTINVTVTPVNDVVVLSQTIADTTLPEDFSGLVFIRKLSNIFQDIDNDSIAFRATVTGGAIGAVIQHDSLYVTSSPDFYGQSTISILASDGSSRDGLGKLSDYFSESANTVETSFRVTQSPVNDPPMRSNPIVDKTYAENFNKVLVQKLSLVFTDIDNSSLTYGVSTISKDQDVFGFISNDSLYVLSSKDSNGVDSIRVTASDGMFTAADTFRVNVTNVNTAPTVTSAINNVTVSEDFGKNFVRLLTTVFSDIDGNALSYSVSVLPGDNDVTAMISNDSLYILSSVDSSGGDTLRVTASDGQYSVQTQFTVTVNPVNDGPKIISALRDTTYNEDFPKTLVRRLSSVFLDADHPSLTYAGSVLSGGASVVVSNDSLYATGTLNANGTAAIRVSATDGTLSVADTFQINIKPVNDAPVFSKTVADTSLLEDFGKVFYRKLSTHVSDVDNASLTYNAYVLSGSIQVQISTDSISLISQADYYGAATIRWTASDGSYTLADTFTVNIANVNDGPVRVTALRDTVFSEDFGHVFVRQLGTVFSDVDNAALIYTATVLSGNATTAIPSGKDSLYIQSSTDFNGDLIIRTTASDGALSVSDTFTVTVSPLNDGPYRTVNISDISVQEEFSKTYVAKLSQHFSDNDDASLSYAVINNPSSFDAMIGGDTLYITSRPDSNGVYSLVVRTKDASLSAYDTLTVTINNVNDAPFVATPLPDTDVDEDFEKYFVADLQQIFSDIDNSTPAYSVTSLTPSVVQAQVSGDSLYLISVPAVYGSGQIRVTADDGQASAADTITVTVNNVNNSPYVANVLRDTVLQEDFGKVFLVTLSSHFSDIDNVSLQYSARALQNGLKAQIHQDSLYVLSDADYYGIVEVEITAADGYLASLDTMQIVLTNTNDAPYMAASAPDIVLNEDFGTWTYGNAGTYFADIDNALTYGVEVLSAGVNAAVFGDTIKLYSTARFYGTSQIRLFATDGQFTISDTMAVQINNVNNTPYVAASVPDTTILEDFGYTWIRTLSPYFQDYDNATLTFAATALTPGVSVETGHDTLYIQSQSDFFGSVAIKLSASDGEYTTTDTMAITIQNVNDSPALSHPMRDTSLAEDFGKTALYQLTDIFSDIDNGSLSYGSEALAAGVTGSISGDTLYVHSTPYFNGDADVRIFATDGEYQVSDTIRISVTGVNNAPYRLAALPDTSLPEDFGKMPYRVVSQFFSDVDNMTLTYSAQVLQGQIGVQTVNDSLYFISVQDFNGAASVKVTASDGFFTVHDTLVLTVTPMNDAPASALPLQPGPSVLTNNLRPTFNWHASKDIDGDAITYTLTVARDNAFSDVILTQQSTDTVATASADMDTTAVLFWRITANDNHGGVVIGPATSFSTDARKAFFQIGVLANTVSPLHVGLYVRSTKQLNGNPAGQFELSENGNVISAHNDTFEKLTAHTEPTYYTNYVIRQSGTLKISVTGTDMVGNVTVAQRNYAVDVLARNKPFATASDGIVWSGTAMSEGMTAIAREDADAGPMNKNTSASLYTDEAISPVYEMIVTADVKGKLTLTYSDDVISNLHRIISGEVDERLIGIYAEENGQWVYIGGQGKNGSVTTSWNKSGKIMARYNPAHTIIPDHVELLQNYPNPFNPSTTIRFGLSENGTVRLTVYNLLGQKVKTLVQQHVAAGYHTIVWNGRNESGHAVSSGVYLYRLEIQGHVVTKKMMFLK